MSRKAEEGELPNGAGTAHLRSRVLKGTVWFMSGTAARAVLRLFVVAVLARLLLPQDFGLVGAASIFLLWADLFATPGLTMTMVQRRDLEPRHIVTGFWGTMVAAGATALVFVLLSGVIADMLRMPRLEPILTWLALLLPLNACSAISQKLMERELAYGKLAAIDTGTYLLGYCCVAVPLALLGYGVWSLVFAQLSAAFLRSACLLWTQPHRLIGMPEWRAYTDLMRTGVGFSLARFFNVLAQKGDYFVVGRWLGAAQLGFYERAYVLMDLSNNLLTNSMSTVLFPAFAKLQHDRAALGRAYIRCCAILGLIFIPAMIAAAILAPEIVAFLLGPRWDAAVLPFQVLAFGMFFRTGSKISNVLANSVGAVYRNARSQAIYAFLIVAGAWLALPYGIVGVAWATLFARASIYLMLTSVALDVTGLKWATLLREYRPALLAGAMTGAVAAGAAFGMRQLHLWPVATLAVALGSALLALGAAMIAAPSLFGSHGNWILSMLRGGLRPLQGRSS